MSTIQNSSLRQMDPDLAGARMEQFQIRQPQIGNVETGSGATPVNEPKGGGFLETLQKSMEEVNADQVSADNSIKDLVRAKTFMRRCFKFKKRISR
jgi:flagellar hook-basal body complex protein FliE